MTNHNASQNTVIQPNEADVLTPEIEMSNNDVNASFTSDIVLENIERNTTFAINIAINKSMSKTHCNMSTIKDLSDSSHFKEELFQKIK